MSHLGDRVTSLVDGQLAGDAAERAYMHTAGCPECREAVEIERLTKRRLATLGTPELGDALIHRLLELAGPCGPMPPRSGHVPGSPRPQLIATGAARTGPDKVGTGWGNAEPGGAALVTGSGRGVGTHPQGRRGSSRPPIARRPGFGGVARVTRPSRNRVAAAMVGAACLVGAGAVGGVANGVVAGQQQVVPPVDSFVLQHDATTGSLPFADQTVLWGTVGAGR